MVDEVNAALGVAAPAEAETPGRLMSTARTVIGQQRCPGMVRRRLEGS